MSTDCKIYVGNLPPDIRTRDVEDLFYKYGKITNISLKTHKGPPYAFVEFEDPRDAEDAVKLKHGYNYDGYALRVNYPFSRRGPRQWDSRGRGGHSGGRRDGRASTSRRTNYRVLVSSIPKSASWQDLKDHMREAGDVCFADVYKDGTGLVEFMRKQDMRYAVKKLDDSKFVSHERDVSYIKVREEVRSSPSRSPTPEVPQGSPGSPVRQRSPGSPARDRSPGSPVRHRSPGNPARGRSPGSPVRQKGPGRRGGQGSFRRRDSDRGPRSSGSPRRRNSARLPSSSGSPRRRDSVRGPSSSGSPRRRDSPGSPGSE